MPVRRVRLGPVQRFEEKGIALPLPEGLTDASPFRSRVESDPASAAVALRIDRSVSPWTTRQIESALVETNVLERMSVEGHESQPVSRVGSAGLLLGRANGKAADEPNARMHYAILDLGGEQLVARYVGSAEQLAYNESVFVGSLVNLEGQRLMNGEAIPVDALEWSRAAPAPSSVPMPSGWVLEPSAPLPCTGLPQPGAIAAAYPGGDVTLALRAAVWNAGTVVPEEAAAACSARRAAGASYASRADWLGVSYAIEGVFVQLGTQQVAQLEVIAPVQKGPLARALLAAWIKTVKGP